MPRRSLTLILIAALFTGAGGHLALLQTIAWIQMIHDRAATTPLPALIQSVFSGEKPCPLCQKVKNLQQKQPEKSPITNIQWTKIETLLTPIHLRIHHNRFPNLASYPYPEDQAFPSLPHTPLTPPPKA